MVASDVRGDHPGRSLAGGRRVAMPPDPKHKTRFRQARAPVFETLAAETPLCCEIILRKCIVFEGPRWAK